MKNTKIITVSLAAALAIGAITANGVLVSADAEKGTIKVAASATPHAEILEEAKPILEKEGWDLEVTVFDDYVQPNLVVESGDFDANYFQHIPYLDNFNEEQAHSQCFSKTSRPGNQCHLSRACTQEFPDQTRFINIIISILPDLRKIRNTYRNFQFRHLISPFHRQS